MWENLIHVSFLAVTAARFPRAVISSLFQALGQWSARRKTTRACVLYWPRAWKRLSDLRRGSRMIWQPWCVHDVSIVPDNTLLRRLRVLHWKKIWTFCPIERNSVLPRWGSPAIITSNSSVKVSAGGRWKREQWIYNCEVNSSRNLFQQLRVGAKVYRVGSRVLAIRERSPLSGDRHFVNSLASTDETKNKINGTIVPTGSCVVWHLFFFFASFKYSTNCIELDINNNTGLW